jgi:guanylate kinase
MNTTNVFCVIAKSGAGKTEYLNRLLSDKKFLKNTKLSLLIYGTTRKKRKGEKEGVDYYYHTQEEYDNINYDDLIESRSYYTLNDGEVYYFTKKEYFDISGNIICITSPYQFENYRNWINRENIRTPNRYKLYAIIIDANIKIRLTRLMERSESEDDIYENCRRVIQEKNEFEDVFTRIPELIDPMIHNNICYIDNNGNREEIDKNIDKIKFFIKKYINE